MANAGFAKPFETGLLSGRGALSRRFPAIALVEAIDASRGIDQLLLSGKERMASRANFHVEVALFGRAGLERLAASAANGDFYVFRVNSWFHLLLCLPSGVHAALNKHAMIGAVTHGRQGCRTTDKSEIKENLTWRGERTLAIIRLRAFLFISSNTVCRNLVRLSSCVVSGR